MRCIPKFEEPLQQRFSENSASNVKKRKRTKNSKNEIIPASARRCAREAITDANLVHPSNIGPRNSEMKNNAINTAAFQTIGPIAMTPILTRGLGYGGPWNDFTNMYAMINNAARNIGQMISE